MKILFEDNHLLAVYKPSGLLTHSDITGDESILERAKHYIKVKCNKPGAVFLQPVHRIDRPTSGLILFARTSKATTRLTNAFKAKEIHKTYLAVVNNKPRQITQELTHYLVKDSKTNIVRALKQSDVGAKQSVLTYQLKGEMRGRFLLEVRPKTGRSHQIRVQLSEIGCPIEGDLKYGSKTKTDGRSIALHAYKLRFLHPTKKEEMEIVCPLPENKIWRDFI